MGWRPSPVRVVAGSQVMARRGMRLVRLMVEPAGLVDRWDVREEKASRKMQWPKPLEERAHALGGEAIEDVCPC